ncbi:MAG: polymer-forming cytoskeletal protein [Eubacterium sp.]|nr:polymer-forming cytoskeletal protein [Eubacterium sp.]
MFGTRKETTVDPALEQVGTIIGPGAVLDGPLTTKDSTRIDGTVKGNVTISGALIVGQEGKIIGTVSAMNAYIAGEVTGAISAPQGKVEISDTGKVIGDVSCKGIIIDENAVFQGKCDMTGIEKSSAEIAKERAVADKSSEEQSQETTEGTKSEDNKSEDNKSEGNKEDDTKSEENKEENKE